MKYKIVKGTVLFDKFKELQEKINDATAKTKEFLASIGAKDFATDTSYNIVKVDAVHLEEKPDGWKSVGQSWQSLYMPKASNKATCKAIRELPVVSVDELNDLVNYHSFVGRDLCISHRPGLHFGEDVVLIEVADCMDWYKPVKGMKKITVAEFNELKAQILKK